VLEISAIGRLKASDLAAEGVGASLRRDAMRREAAFIFSEGSEGARISLDLTAL
jgi:hypothetical protein